jgi:cytochrome c556
MKMRSRVLAVVLVLAAIGLGTALAQTRRSRATKEFMRDKLELSQKVLEGLAMEDYDLISAKAQKLSAMSREAPWQVFENPDYAQHSITFRRNADSLVRAAREKNLDAATLAYVRMTMSCVDCHKFVRGKVVAQAAPPSLAANLP